MSEQNQSPSDELIREAIAFANNATGEEASELDEKDARKVITEKRLFFFSSWGAIVAGYIAGAKDRDALKAELDALKLDAQTKTMFGDAVISCSNCFGHPCQCKSTTE